MPYTIPNLPKVAIWSPNGFRIHPHLAEKSTTLLIHGTFGHPVGSSNTRTILSQAQYLNCNLKPDFWGFPQLTSVDYLLLAYSFEWEILHACRPSQPSGHPYIRASPSMKGTCAYVRLSSGAGSLAKGSPLLPPEVESP